MMKPTRIRLFSALIVLSTLLITSSSFASDYPLKEKLQQCEDAFDKMHSGELSQEQAWKLRREHKKLVKEILASLNEHNHAILKNKDHEMTSEEILDNFIVMGSLLEMLASENLRLTDEFGYPVSR